jgi:hypothetical protein
VNLVPTLCVGMPSRTLRVPPSTQDLNLVHLVTRSVTGCIPTRSVGTIDAQKPMNLVPMLCVGMPPWTLRVPASTQDLNLVHLVTRSVTGCIPTRSVGTIDAQKPINLVPALCVGMPPWTLRVPANTQDLNLVHLCDAERHGLHSHAERGNDRRSEADEPRSHALRGNASMDAPRPGKHARFEPCASL